MKTILTFILFLTLACFLGCLSVHIGSQNKESTKYSKEEIEARNSKITNPRCFLKPDPGHCKASFERFYYDPNEGKCKSFIYGGGGGVVPFTTMEECKKECGCD